MINRVLVMGRLTKDPELSTTAGGDHVCNFAVAINEPAKNGQSRTIFVDVSIWKKQAESLVQYKRKGDLVFIDGKLNLNEWVDQRTQQKRSKLSVTAFSIQFLDGAPSGMASQPQPATHELEDWN